MTITVNNVNNLEQMLSGTAKALRGADKTISGVDKTVGDFKYVMDKTLNHADKQTESVIQKQGSDNKTTEVDGKIVEAQEKVVEIKEQISNAQAQVVETKNKTISDLKQSSVIQISTEIGQAIVENVKDLISIEELPKDWKDFKEVLTQITDEANVETSLDLTLARDISEIIAQLKEAVENAAKIVDKNNDFSTESDETDESIDIAEELLVALENINNQGENAESSETEQENDGSKEVKVPFEQLLTFTDKVTEPKIDTEVEVFKSDETTNLSDNLNTSQGEILEFAENLADEIVTTKSAQGDVDSKSELIVDEDLLKDLNVESVKVEADTTGEESFMQNQTPQEQSLKAILTAEPETFDLKIENVQNQTNNQLSQAKTIDINPSRIIDQVTKHLEALQNNSKVNIVLNPESLGKVNVQLLTTKEGLAAQFTVTTQEARDLLMKGLDGLKDALASHGVGVDNVSVKVADSQKSEYRQDWTEQEGSRGGNKGQGQPNREEKEKGLFEKMMAQTEEKENGNV